MFSEHAGALSLDGYHILVSLMDDNDLKLNAAGLLLPFSIILVTNFSAIAPMVDGTNICKRLNKYSAISIARYCVRSQ